MARRAWAVLPPLALVAATVWFAALLVAPVLLPPGTVAGLDGHANHVDHLALWLDQPMVPAVVYGVGDVLCHQKATRSVMLAGNQLPVASRMTGIFAGAVVGLAVGARRGLPREAWFAGGAFLDAVAWPRRWRPGGQWTDAAIALGVLAVAVAPSALDVAVQFVSSYESTVPRRLWTGAVAGVAGGVALAAGLRVVETMARAVWARRV